MNEFKATDCITFGWEMFKKRPWYLIGVLILSYIPGAIINMLQSHSHALAHALFSALSCFVSIAIALLLTRFVLRAHEDLEHLDLKNGWENLDWNLFWNFFAASVLVGVVVVLGLILLIVPGIILALMFSQTIYLVVDRKLGPIEAMKESKRITDGHKWELFLLMLLSIGIVILGVVCLFVGLLVAIPVVYLAQVHAYRLLEGRADAVVPAAPATPLN